MFTKDDIIVIPARKGSKGVPFKNRLLIEQTLRTIPSKYKDNVYIYSDDEFIIDKYKNYKHVPRPPKYSGDKTSTKDTMLSFFNSLGVTKGNCIMLYVVYPTRKWGDVVKSYEYFIDNEAKSLLCKKPYDGIHPYLLMVEDGINGKQITPHNLYRRQDYPKVFELTHYVTIFNIEELPKLNNNLYNEDTIYFTINNDDIIDIDTKKDVLKWKGQK